MVEKTGEKFLLNLENFYTPPFFLVCIQQNIGDFSFL